MEKVQTKRIAEFDIIRVLAMFWVVTYHFGCEYQMGNLNIPLLNFFCFTPNFDFGNVAVTMFLMLSGALLYRKYGQKEIDSLGKFYWARARTIYPPFWIVNLYVLLTMARHWVSDGSPFFAGNPLKLLLTVTGFDGYFQLFGVESYYFCGEWFVGAIVTLYLLFPLLAKAYRKCRSLTLLFLCACYASQFFLPNSWSLDISAYPFTLMFKFVLGFVVIDALPKLQSKKTGAISLVLFLVLSLLYFPNGFYKNDLMGTVAGISVLLTVLAFGKSLMKSSLIQKAVTTLGPISYCVFLIQHIAIVWLQMAFVKLLGQPVETFSPWLCLGLLAVTFLGIVIAAFGLKLVSDKSLKFVERKFLS